MNYNTDDSAQLSVNKVQLLPGVELSSTEKEALQSYYDQFNSKEFLLHQAQGLPQFVTQNAYSIEEINFKKIFKEVHFSDIPADANIISSHVLYKVKVNDDNSLMMKARIGPHGNKDRDKHNLKTDFALCPPIGIRVLLSMANMFKWTLAKSDVKSAFLQTGTAERDIYVVPPRESRKKSFYWHLLTAAYGLVNASAKWQDHSDSFFYEIGFQQLPYIPHLFYMSNICSGPVFVLATKVVDDILIAGDMSHVKAIVEKIDARFKLGTVVYGPGRFIYFGLTIVQHVDYSIVVNADDKLEALESYPLDRFRRRQIEEPLNEIELSAIRSLNGSIGWIGIVASPFCSFYSSLLQQKGGKCIRHHFSG